MHDPFGNIGIISNLGGSIAVAHYPLQKLNFSTCKQTTGNS